MVSNKIISMKKLSICLFLVLFGFSAPSFADHLLKKSKEESLIFHKQRMNELPNNAHPIWKNYKNEIIKKANSPKVLKDNSKPNKKLKKNEKRSHLL